MKRLTVTLTFSYTQDDGDDVQEEYDGWRLTPNLMMESITPVDFETNSRAFRMESIHIEEGVSAE